MTSEAGTKCIIGVPPRVCELLGVDRKLVQSVGIMFNNEGFAVVNIEFIPSAENTIIAELMKDKELVLVQKER